MANLKQGYVLAKDNLHIDFFEAEECGSLLEFFLVENDSLVLVKEIVSEEIAYTFFNLSSQEKIDRTTRYKQENGRITTSEFGGCYKVFTEASVDSKTGFEIVNEKIIKGDEIVYKNTMERFQLEEIETVSKRFFAFEAQKNYYEKMIDKIIEDFFKSEYLDKINRLRSLFRREWRNRCELGIEHPEYFLSRDMYNRLSKDIRFNDALLEMLKLEGVVVGISAEELYKSIETYYLGG